MKKNIIAMSAVMLLLSACGGAAKDEKKAAEASGPVKREAGNWKTDIKMVSLNAPGMNEQMKGMMSKQLEGMSGIETCLTPEQAAKEDLAKDMSKNASMGAECTFSKQDISGGKIDVVGKCKSAQGQEVDLAMNGTMEPKKTDVNITTNVALPGGTGKMEMVMKMTSNHSGACKTS